MRINNENIMYNTIRLIKEAVGVPYDYVEDADQCKATIAAIYGILRAIELANLPSAQTKWKWIPVSEGLPEEDTDVLISYRYKEGEGDTSHVYIEITSYGDMYFGGRKVKGAKHWRQPFEYFASNYEVIAWMPLPKPWKGEENDSD